MRIPVTLYAGDSVAWLDDESKDNLGNAIAPGDWALTYFIRGKSSLDLVAVVEGTQWKTSLTAAQTQDLEPGYYYWQAVASKASDKVTLGSGQLQVLAGLSAQDDGFDGRTQNKKDLEAVQSAIRAMIAGGAVSEYTIGNRSVKKMSLSDLMSLESKLKAEVVKEERAQKIAQGLGDPKNLYVRFR